MSVTGRMHIDMTTDSEPIQSKTQKSYRHLQIVLFNYYSIQILRLTAKKLVAWFRVSSLSSVRVSIIS